MNKDEYLKSKINDNELLGEGNPICALRKENEFLHNRIKELEIALSGKSQFYCQCGGVKLSTNPDTNKP